MSPQLSFGISFLIAFLVLPPLIRLLNRRKLEQVISEDLPEHREKQGTPTLGGVAIVLGASLVGVVQSVLNRSDDLLALVLLFLGTAFLGFYDDCLILTRGRNAGQRWSHKLLTQLLLSAAFTGFLWLHDGPAYSTINVGRNSVIELGYAWIPLSMLYLTLISNAVNLSDGMDGLAGGLCIFAAIACAVAAELAHLPDLVVFLAAVAGACLGFLWYNWHPAEIFMGNTSSIALGMALGGAALMTRWLPILIVPMAVFLAEAASVVIQIGYFKRTRRRVFLKAPLHHHFQMLGWKETRIVGRFWIAGVLAALLGVSLLPL